MDYNPKQDKIIEDWKIPVTDTQTAIVSLKSYDNNDPKLQIGVIEIKKDNGEIAHARIKRWGWSELLKLREVLDQAIDKMDDMT